ncbi:MAG: lamin tail domain-containing protein, partial [Phycisphaerales bacterium]
GYLLIWADDDVGDYGLHTNFKLDADGEQVALFATDGITLIDSLELGDQTSDISFGRYPDATDNLRFLANATPGAPNDGAYLGQVEAPQFSHKRGFYDRPFMVTLATETQDAIIHYTLDGAVPYERIGRITTGTVYTGPISIHRTTCLRAKAIKPGWKESATKTATYVLNASDEVKSLPLISLVADERRTFYEPDGVMAIVGGSYSGNGTWVSSGPSSHNNMIHRGMAYERPVSFEWIMPEDNSGFQVDCGLRVHGSDYMRPRYRRQNGYWTGNGKIAFRLYFRGRYGPNWLEYPLFPFEIERFKSIVIRSGHNDRVNPFIKDELIRRLQKDMGHVASGGTMANLFINGEYKGYFNPCEHIKDAFCQQWYKSDEPWDVVTMSGIRDGDAVSWNALLNYARNNDLSQETHYQYVAKRLDVPAFIDYLILQLWAANWDWPQNNWSAAAEHSDQGIWRFFVWDAEGTFGPADLNKSGFTDFPSWASQPAGLNNLSTPIAWFYRALKANETFTRQFGDRLNKHFYNDGALTEANIRRRFHELRDQMLGVIPNMDTYTLTGWVPNRLDVFLSQCAREGLFTSPGPRFSINGVRRHGGHLSNGDTLTMTNEGRFQTIYYTLDGSDPEPGEEPQPANITSTILFTENADKRALVPIRALSDGWKGGGFFDDSAWDPGAAGAGGVGFERRRSQIYTKFIGLNVEQQMYLRSATCYIRIPFVFGGVPAIFDLMTLRIKYNDGFIAYLNGTEVARRNFTGTPTWNSHADNKRLDSAALQFEDIDISASLDSLRYGNNILAIHGLNSSAQDLDFFISAELLAGQAETDKTDQANVFQFDGPITLPHSAIVKARTLIGRTWSALSEATFSVGPIAENLRITEIMYHPQDPNEEFIELKNIGTESVNLNLVSFTDGIDFVFGDFDLSPGEHTVLVRNSSAFAARYQIGRQAVSVKVAGQYEGRLDNTGERIRLQDATGRTILDFTCEDGWRSLSDGGGFSLTIVDPANPDPDSWNEKDSWRSSAYSGGSPGSDDGGTIPNPGDIVINEVLTNPLAGASDWIELYNTTGKAIDIGGWFLSDDRDFLAKYEIAHGTAIGPYDYLVLYQNLHFGNANDPGAHMTFGLSRNGEQVRLSSSQNGVWTGYRDVEDFGASANGVSFGRYYKPSTNNYNFVAMSIPTPGAANSDPKVGPIVISEIMYNPDWPVGSAYTNEQYEYIELYNITSEPVTLFDYDTALPWKLTDGIEFTFPKDFPVTLAPDGRILVVKNPEAFSVRYPRVPADQILGPYDGKLRNSGEKLELSMPGDIDGDGRRSYIRIDRVNYSDGSHPDDSPGSIDPWPVQPDGYGGSLTRRTPAHYGNDPANWTWAFPSPGE